jgi:ATP-binding cassette, subfamily B, bacterial PglK
MIKRIEMSAMRKLWQILTPRERRTGLLLLGLSAVSAVSTTAMVASIMPFLTLLSNPSTLDNSKVFQSLYAYFDFSSPYAFLTALAVLAMVMIVFGVAMQITRAYALARFSLMRSHSFSHRLMLSYMGQPYEYFLSHHSGDMGTRILNEADTVVIRYLRPLVDCISAIIAVTVLTIFLLWLNAVVAISFFVAFATVYFIAYRISRAKLNQWGKKRVGYNTERFRLAYEAIGGVKEIKLLGREALYIQQFNQSSSAFFRLQTSTTIVSQVPFLAIQGMAFLSVILLCLLLIDAETFTNSDALATIVPLLGTFAFAGQRMMPELGSIYQAITQMQSGRASLDIVHKDLSAMNDTHHARLTVPDSRSLMPLQQTLQLDAVCYRYPNTQQDCLSDISFSINAGEKIGIVGLTGAGKSTLADVILGLLPATSGQISVDGTLLTDELMRSWQQTLGYVPQDMFLLDASVSENIAIGVQPTQIDDVRVRNAANIANIAAFIEQELPEGYATRIGERGVRLSGGQRQRIGIARALYHDAALIVFDEATSALDNNTEAEVMAAIDALPQDKTILLIAHRLSTVKDCDRIIVMDNGRLVAIDTWDNLMQHCDVFQRIASI